jgi:hypothetical protein
MSSEDRERGGGAAGGDENLLPLDESAGALPQDCSEAIRTLGAQVAEYERRGEDGLRPLSLLLERLDEEIFSTGVAAKARAQSRKRDTIDGGVLLFAARNLEVLLRALADDRLLSSGLGYVLREAPEDFVIAHALAAIDVIRAAEDEGLRSRGKVAYGSCLEIARERGFGGRVVDAFESAMEVGDGGTGDAA